MVATLSIHAFLMHVFVCDFVWHFCQWVNCEVILWRFYSKLAKVLSWFFCGFSCRFSTGSWANRLHSYLLVEPLHYYVFFTKYLDYFCRQQVNFIVLLVPWNLWGCCACKRFLVMRPPLHITNNYSKYFLVPITLSFHYCNIYTNIL